jgi:hypothetical protein
VQGRSVAVRRLPIGVNLRAQALAGPDREGARPRAPQRRAQLTDVLRQSAAYSCPTFRSLDRQTRSASRTIPRPRDGDAIPPSAPGSAAARSVRSKGMP